KRRKHGRKQRVGHVNEIEDGAGGESIASINDKLGQQVAADTMRCVVQHIGGEIDLPGSRETNETIPQILLLNQHENDKHDHNHCVEHYANDCAKNLVNGFDGGEGCTADFHR